MARCSAVTDDFRQCRRAEGHEGDHSAAPRGTRLRNVRVPDDPWELAKQIAAVRGETLSDVIRANLERYVKRHRALIEKPPKR